MIWKNSKRWVYSVTYDEGCRRLLEHALPLHRRYGIPGHVALVASQVGIPRDLPGSSYDGMMILSREEIDELCAEGWSVSCHGMTHAAITPENARCEVVEARRVLEETLRRPVALFCVPGNNNSYPATLEVASEAGYTAIMTLADKVNVVEEIRMRHPSASTPEDLSEKPEDSGILHLGRVPLHTEYPPPFYSQFDPYKRLHQAMDRGGWVIDYCHCPLPGKAVHPWKDCTLEQLEERFATVRKVGGKGVWLAEPGEVVEYILGSSRGCAESKVTPI